MHAEFFSPAVLDEQLNVATYFTHIGRTSLVINFDVMSATSGKKHVTAHQVLVCVARQSMTKQALPVEIVRALEPFCALARSPSRNK
ncbi:MAG: acyl-CoA thioesterase [Gemmatimonadaceae bacterium]